MIWYVFYRPCDKIIRSSQHCFKRAGGGGELYVKYHNEAQIMYSYIRSQCEAFSPFTAVAIAVCDLENDSRLSAVFCGYPRFFLQRFAASCVFI